MTTDPANYYGLAVAAALDGDNVALRIQRDAAAAALAFDHRAPLLPRLLGAVASGVMAAEVAGPALGSQPELRQAVVDLSQAQAGDVRIDQVAGGDIITVNVYVGTQGGQDGTREV